MKPWIEEMSFTEEAKDQTNLFFFSSSCLLSVYLWQPECVNEEKYNDKVKK